MGEEGIMLMTDFTGELVKFDIKDGKTVINDKEFIIDRVQPIILKKKRLGKMRHTPFYLLKWDKVEPAHIEVIETDIDGDKYDEIVSTPILRSLEVVFPDKEKGDVLPEMLRETHDMRYMKHLKKYAGDGVKGGGSKFQFQRWMLVPVALIISAIAMFVINGFKFI
jgi:hypothetical protein